MRQNADLLNGGKYGGGITEKSVQYEVLENNRMNEEHQIYHKSCNVFFKNILRFFD